MPTTTSHFTAVIQVSQVITTEDRGTGRGDDRTRTVDREVSKLVIRAKTMEALKTKVAAHVALVEEEM